MSILCFPNVTLYIYEDLKRSFLKTYSQVRLELNLCVVTTQHCPALKTVAQNIKFTSPRRDRVFDYFFYTSVKIYVSKNVKKYSRPIRAEANNIRKPRAKVINTNIVTSSRIPQHIPVVLDRK